MGSSDFRLLIAHENPTLREQYQKFLEDEGYQVEIVECSAKILSRLEKEKFNLLVTDLEIGPVNTLEILQSIRQSMPGLAIVVVAGYYLNVFGDTQVKGHKEHLFFTKPLTLLNLKNAVRQTLGQSPEGND